MTCSSTDYAKLDVRVMNYMNKAVLAFHFLVLFVKLLVAFLRDMMKS